ncbi:acetyl-CoA synthetase-like protein [Saccharata proteae CBS 121410]|uniref:Acetyl-CoA synthetase-like protein n=1 Tax=Saccharata proteae CBS 121410 TaxID=1314787 RepID=A0A9P4HP22_9PEZI|nr:acetyl-CoA synthetase-like protein [Saccharata proteae CBS 121410]
MPFLATEQLQVPTKDVLSWYFDDPQYDLDKPLYIDAACPDRCHTAREARTLIRKLAAGFTAAGLKKGDVVCIHSFNDIDYPILVNGIVGFGGIWSGTNPSYTPYELSHAVKSAHIKFFIVEPEILKNVVVAAKENGIPESRILVFDKPGETVPEGFRSWRTLLECDEMDWPRFDDAETAKSTMIARCFSSGTTGLPKAAMISHYNFIAQHVIVNDWSPKPYKPTRLIPMPFFHVAVAPTIHFSPLRNGTATYVMRRFQLEPYLQYMERYAITDMAVVPPIAIAIIMSPASKKYSLKAVRTASCGAAPLDKGPQARLQALLAPDAPFTQVWGMTETTCIASMFPWPESDVTGSVGRFAPSLDVKLVDDAGSDITGYDVRGELCVRGPTVVKGYVDNPEGNKSWDADGFFHTGDIAYCDGKNKLWYIVDRKKELIKVRGFQVAPPEIEAVLLSHPHVVDAAVIGVNFSRDESEFPRAYVVRRQTPEGESLTAKDIKEYAAKSLAGYKRLEGGVLFLDEIPKNPSGKILKKTLREMAKKEMGAKL